MRLLQFEFGDHVDMFSISDTGTLDFAATFESSQSMETRRLVRDFCGAFTQEIGIPFINGNWDDHNFELYDESCRIILHYLSNDSDSLKAPIHGFCQRYPSFALSMSRGDFLCSARILLRSSKLRPYHTLLSYMYRDISTWPLILYHLQDFSDDAGKYLRNAISHCGDTTDAYLLLTNFAENFGSLPFANSTELRSYFTTHSRWLQLPVVGGHYHQHAVDGIIGQMQKVYDLVLEDRLRGNISASETQRTFQQRIELLFPVTLVREVSNLHDPNAIAVLVSGADGIERHVGYLRKTVAQALEDLSACRASIAAVGAGKIELKLISDATEDAVSF